MVGLSKSRIIQHRQCPKRLWLRVNRPELLVEDPAAAARMAEGSEVGAVARSLYPQGVSIDNDSLRDSLTETRKVLKAPQRRPIFEATLEANHVLVRVDLLLPESEGYRLVEVKSSTRVKDYHLEDAVVQSWVAQQAGVPVTSVEIAHLNRAFVYVGDGDYSGLFTYIDITETIQPQQSAVPDWIAAAQETLRGPEPAIEPGEQCRKPFECPFIPYCSPQTLDKTRYPVSVLPYGGKLAAALTQQGYSDLREVPEQRLSKPNHLRVWRATCSGEAELDPAAMSTIAALDYPRYYLDFETLGPAIPRWPGTRPYDTLPFQWSCHIEQADGTLSHHYFLAENDNDPRRALAESLVDILDEEGPILAYNAGFESGCLLSLAALFPDLSGALEAASERLVDLLPIARNYYYHRDMRGSWSIKAVLPTIAPDLAYDDLEVGDGAMAQEAFAEMVDPETSAERRQQLHQALLTYCERDTLAMVRIAHYFEGR